MLTMKWCLILEIFDTVVVLTPDLRPLGDTVFHLMEWVESGGDVMFAMTLQKDEVTSAIEHKLGIINASDTYAKVEEVSIKMALCWERGRIMLLISPLILLGQLSLMIMQRFT